MDTFINYVIPAKFIREDDKPESVYIVFYCHKTSRGLIML